MVPFLYRLIKVLMVTVSLERSNCFPSSTSMSSSGIKETASAKASSTVVSFSMVVMLVFSVMVLSSLISVTSLVMSMIFMLVVITKFSSQLKRCADIKFVWFHTGGADSSAPFFLQSFMLQIKRLEP